MTGITTGSPLFQAWWAPLDRLAAVAPHPDDARLGTRRFAPRARTAFLARRAIMRLALARASLGGADRIDLVNAGGVPTAIGGTGPAYVSVASADSLAVCALSRFAPVGVDVEADRNVAGFELLLDRCHASERAAVLSLPAARRPRAFLTLWTAKESVVKATGLSLDAVLAEQRLELDEEDGEPRWRPAVPRAWEIVPLRIPGHVASACAVRSIASAGQAWRRR